MTWAADAGFPGHVAASHSIREQSASCVAGEVNGLHGDALPLL